MRIIVQPQYIRRDRFDFEIGYLTKSPCVNCPKREDFPKCQPSCQVIDKVRTLLAGGISSQASSYDT